MNATRNNSDKRKTITDLHERVWLVCFRKGDMTALERILQVYQSSIFSFLKRFSLSQTDCEQLFENIFLEIYANASSYSPAEPLKPWIFKIVVAELRRFKGAQKLKPTPDKPFRLEHETGEFPAGDSTLENISADSEHKVFIDWLNTAICQYLPDKQIEVLLLSLIEDFNKEDLANILTTNIDNVEYELNTARHALLSHWHDVIDKPLESNARYVNL